MTTTLLLAALTLAAPARAQFGDYPSRSATDVKEQGETDPGYEIYPSYAQPAPRLHRAPPKKRDSGWEFTGNPDRYPSLTLQESGAETVNGHQDFATSSTSSDNRTSRQFAINALLTAILPLSDHWSLTAGGGANYNETNQYASPTRPLVVNDNSVAVYAAGLRYYMVGARTIWSTAKNPDRWPSFGVLVTGNGTVHLDVTASSNGINQPLYTRLWRLDNENRIPLSDWYTLIVTATGQYSRTQLGEEPTLAASDTILRSVGGTLEHRFYLVDRNLLADDDGRNPDRWSSVYFNTSGLRSVSGKASSSQLGVLSSRYAESTFFGSALGTRLPMTSRATLRLELNYSYTDTKLPFTPALAGTRTRVSQLGGLLSLRYYCL